MMSQEEQQAQSESIKNIEGVAQAIKRWWPILTVACALIGAGASGVTAFFHYDNNNKEQYASKKDLQEVSYKVDKLISAVNTLANQETGHHLKDSLNAAELKQTVMYNKRNTDRALSEIKWQLNKWSFTTAKWNSDHTKLTYSGAN